MPHSTLVTTIGNHISLCENLFGLCLLLDCGLLSVCRSPSLGWHRAPLGPRVLTEQAWLYLCRGTAERPWCRHDTPPVAGRPWTRRRGSGSADTRGAHFTRHSLPSSTQSETTWVSYSFVCTVSCLVGNAYPSRSIWVPSSKNTD